MPSAIGVRRDYTAADLRILARRSDSADQVRRLLAAAPILDGGSRSEAAKIAGVTLQIVREWVLRFNEGGPAGLATRKAPGRASILNDEKRARLAEIVEAGPVPAAHGVARCDDGLVVPRAPGQSQGDRQALRAFRCRTDRTRLSRHGRADHRCQRRTGPETAQHPRGKSRDQGRPHACGLEAGQSPAEGSRCALVDQIQQGQGQGRWQSQGGPKVPGAGRSCHSHVRLQEPCRHRPGARADPHLGC